jgi:hypothetical protein
MDPQTNTFLRKRENTAVVKEAFSIPSVPRCYNQDKLPVAVRLQIGGVSKLQTHPLVREGTPYQETRNRRTENKNLMGARHQDRLAAIGRKLTSTSTSTLVAVRELLRFSRGELLLLETGI